MKNVKIVEKRSKISKKRKKTDKNIQKPYLLEPPPIAIDAANSIECVKIFDRGGRILQKFGEPGEERGQFWVPFALQIDHSNNIWVADFTYGSIQIFDEKGKLKEVFPSKEKERGAGVFSTFALASNGQVFAFSALL